MLAMVLTGLLGVVLLVVGLQHAAGVVRPHAPRTARVGAVADLRRDARLPGRARPDARDVRPRGMDGPGRRAAVLEHLETAPVLLVLVAPVPARHVRRRRALTVGLFRSAGVPRWVPACWALFLPLDLFAAGAGPVDPHWLFLAGAVGVALAGRPAAEKR
jgi:hypothetical protein